MVLEMQDNGKSGIESYTWSQKHMREKRYSLQLLLLAENVSRMKREALAVLPQAFLLYPQPLPTPSEL